MAEVTSSSLVGSTHVIPIGKRKALCKAKGPMFAPGPFNSYPTVTRLSEGVPHRTRRLIPHRGQVMIVDVEGHGDIGMSQ